MLTDLMRSRSLAGLACAALVVTAGCSTSGVRKAPEVTLKAVTAAPLIALRTQPSAVWSVDLSQRFTRVDEVFYGGGMAFVVEQTDSDRGQLLALDGKTGAVRWSTDVPSGRYAPFLVEDGVIVYSGASVIGLDLATGTQLWSVAGSIVRTSALSQGVLVLALSPTRNQTDGQLRAIGIKDGRTRWTRDSHTLTESGNLDGGLTDGLLRATSATTMLSGESYDSPVLDIATGKVLAHLAPPDVSQLGPVLGHERDKDTELYSLSGRPLSTKSALGMIRSEAGMLVSEGSDRNTYVRDPSDGHVLWTSPEPLAFGDAEVVVYLDAKFQFQGVSAHTGQVRWSLPGQGQSHVDEPDDNAADTAFYLSEKQAQGWVVEAVDISSGIVAWSVNEPDQSTLGVCENGLLVATDGHLSLLRASS
jgi:outer membrane protein assembly factor BamB